MISGLHFVASTASNNMVCEMHVVVVETNLTFDGRGWEISEEADGHFQNVSLLQFGVACVVFANQRKNQAFQVTETVVDTSTSSLL